MESLEGLVERMDTKKMPQFLDQVSEDARENETSQHFAISLYAQLAQVHKQGVVPYIPRIMASIVRSLSFTADTQQLHVACAKVVAAVARYTVDPTRPSEWNQKVLCDLCSPLLPVMSGKLGSSAAGAAMCLQALIESEKWKFASSELQDLICTKVTAALAERGAHNVAFLRLVKSLVKFSKNSAQGHVTEWLRVALQLLQEQSGIPRLWQQRVAAAQLIASIFKTADAQKLDLDLQATTQVLESSLTDKVSVVQMAVAHAFDVVKCLALEKHVHREINSDYSESDDAGSPGSCFQMKMKNSDTEESGLHELSDSISSRSGTSSHEALPSMTSSTVNFGTGVKRAPVKQLLTHAALSFSWPAKENALALTTRRVLSEIPASGKLLSNLEVLPSPCRSKPLRSSSVDIESKTNSFLVQNKFSLPPGKSVSLVHNSRHDAAVKNCLVERKHVEGCQNSSDRGCMCSIDSAWKIEQDLRKGFDKNVGSTDHLNGKEDGKTFEEHDDCGEEGRHKLSINSVDTSGCMHDDKVSSKFADDVLSNGIPVLVTSGSAMSECTAISGKKNHIKVVKSHAPPEVFSFRSPRSLMPSLESSSTTEGRGMLRQSHKECADTEMNIARKASWILVSDGSDEDNRVGTDLQSLSGSGCTSKLRDVHQFGKGEWLMMMITRVLNNRQICGLGLVCALGILVVAFAVIQLAHQSHYGLHALVPT